MNISAIGVSIPSLKITNDYIIELIKSQNINCDKETVNKYIRMVSIMFKKSGSQTRYFRDKAIGETTIQLVQVAVKRALEDANMDKGKIDLLIYGGVSKGFLEPANAYFITSSLDLDCNCFDVSDACMSWVRSLELSYALLKQGFYENILIVNAECNIYEHGHPNLYNIKSLEQIEYTFPAYTIGEAVTATILSASDKEWSFAFKSAPQYADKCCIPLQGFEDYCINREDVCVNGVNNFFAYGTDMLKVTKQFMIPLIQDNVKEINRPSLWFPHLPSKYTVTEIGNAVGIQHDKLFTKTFSKYGNIVSAAIPTAIDIAVREKRLSRGDQVVLCPASAGMTFAVVQFTY